MTISTQNTIASTRVEESAFQRAKNFAKAHPFLAAGIAVTAVTTTALTAIGLHASVNAWKTANFTAGQSFLSKISHIGNAGVTAVKDTVVSNANAIHETTSSALHTATEKMGNGFSTVKETVISNANAVQETVSSALHTVTEKMGNGFSTVKETVISNTNAVQETVSSTLHSVKEKVGNGFSTVKETVVGKADQMSSAAFSVYTNSVPNSIQNGLSNIAYDLEKVTAKIFKSTADTIFGTRSIVNPSCLKLETLITAQGPVSRILENKCPVAFK